MNSKTNAEKIIVLIKSRNGIEVKQVCVLLNITLGQWQLAQPYFKSQCYRLKKKWYMNVVATVPPRISFNDDDLYTYNTETLELQAGRAAHYERTTQPAAPLKTVRGMTAKYLGLWQYKAEVAV